MKSSTSKYNKTDKAAECQKKRNKTYNAAERQKSMSRLSNK